MSMATDRVNLVMCFRSEYSGWKVKRNFCNSSRSHAMIAIARFGI